MHTQEDNLPYSYYIYHMWANLSALNAFRSVTRRAVSSPAEGSRATGQQSTRTAEHQNSRATGTQSTRAEPVRISTPPSTPSCPSLSSLLERSPQVIDHLTSHFPHVGQPARPQRLPATHPHTCRVNFLIIKHPPPEDHHKDLGIGLL